RSGQSVQTSTSRRAAGAARGGCDDLFHSSDWWRDAGDGIWALDRGGEADYGRGATVVGKRWAGRASQIPDHRARPSPQTRYEPESLQGDLLVGVVSSPFGTRDWHCVSSAISIFSMARRDSY